jgi:hypothetical protein
MKQAQALKSLGNKPLLVVTAAGGDVQAGGLPTQDDLAKLSTNSLHLVLPGATHSSPVETEGDAGLSTEAILKVVGSVRTSSSLAK